MYVGGVVRGFREGRCDVSSGLSQPGGKSCCTLTSYPLTFIDSQYMMVYVTSYSKVTRGEILKLYMKYSKIKLKLKGNDEGVE